MFPCRLSCVVLVVSFYPKLSKYRYLRSKAGKPYFLFSMVRLVTRLYNREDGDLFRAQIKVFVLEPRKPGGQTLCGSLHAGVISTGSWLIHGEHGLWSCHTWMQFLKEFNVFFELDNLPAFMFADERTCHLCLVYLGVNIYIYLNITRHRGTKKHDLHER